MKQGKRLGGEMPKKFPSEVDNEKINTDIHNVFSPVGTKTNIGEMTWKTKTFHEKDEINSYFFMPEGRRQNYFSWL